MIKNNYLNINFVVKYSVIILVLLLFALSYCYKTINFIEFNIYFIDDYFKLYPNAKKYLSLFDVDIENKTFIVNENSHKYISENLFKDFLIDFIDKYKIIFKNKYNKDYMFSKFKFDIPIIYFSKDEIIEKICEKIIDEKLEYSAYFKLKHKIEINNIYYLEYIWEYRERCKSKEDFDDMTDSHSFTIIISLENLCIMWDHCA